MRTQPISQSRPTALAAILLTAFTLACGGRADSPVTPPKGSDSAVDVRLTINLTTPNNDDGAMLLAITGPSIRSVTASTGLEVDESRVTSNGATTSTIIFRGNLASGAIGEVTVGAQDFDAAAYTLQVRQVAARASGGYALRSDLSAYRVTIRR
jgi:hypothetical protein